LYEWHRDDLLTSEIIVVLISNILPFIKPAFNHTQRTSRMASVEIFPLQTALWNIRRAIFWGFEFLSLVDKESFHPNKTFFIPGSLIAGMLVGLRLLGWHCRYN